MQEKIKNRLSHLIRKYMKERGFNQDQMAAHLGVHQTLISAYLRGSYAPRLGRLIEILSLIDVSLDSFLESVDSDTTDTAEQELELA